MCQTLSYMLLIILVISLKGSKTAPSWFFHFCCINLGIYLAIRHSVSFALYDECVCVCVYTHTCIHTYIGLPWGLRGAESACQCRRQFDPGVRKIPWQRKWQPTLELLPGKPHGQRSLAGYSPWGCKRVGHD